MLGVSKDTSVILTEGAWAAISDSYSQPSPAGQRFSRGMVLPSSRASSPSSCSTTRGSQWRSTSAVSRGDSRQLSGTNIAPSFQQANIVSKWSVLLRATRATRSKGRTPYSLRSPAARRVARSLNSP